MTYDELKEQAIINAKLAFYKEVGDYLTAFEGHPKTGEHAREIEDIYWKYHDDIQKIRQETGNVINKFTKAN